MKSEHIVIAADVGGTNTKLGARPFRTAPT